MSDAGKKVRDFYDQVGWKTIDGIFVDTLKFADRRPVVLQYFETIHRRARAHLKTGGGRFILDAASGPIPHPEQAVYSEGFDYRICLDFSFEALLAARAKLGSKGLYILADITRLPLPDDSMDAVISLHTLYHVPANEQETALREIYRVLRPTARAVVVYSWGQHSILMKLTSPNRRINRRIAAFLKRKEAKSELPHVPPVNLYFYTHPYSWFQRVLGSMGSFKLACWRSVSVDFQRAYIHERFYGKQILAALAWLEETFPWISGRLGQNPMFIIQKARLVSRAPDRDRSADSSR